VRKILIAIVVFTELLVLCGCVSVEKEKELAKFILSHVEKIEPLTIQANVTYYDVSTGEILTPKYFVNQFVK